MKLIFLDIDGVLNSQTWFISNRENIIKQTSSMFDRSVAELDPRAVAMLKEFVLKHNAKIVISSTWRKFMDPDEFINMFELLGWDNFPIIGVTPEHLDGFRGREIDAWLDGQMSYFVDKFLIIDDDGDMTEKQFWENFVQTSWDDGLQPAHLIKMESIFLGE